MKGEEDNNGRKQERGKHQNRDRSIYLAEKNRPGLLGGSCLCTFARGTVRDGFNTSCFGGTAWNFNRISYNHGLVLILNDASRSFRFGNRNCALRVQVSQGSNHRAVLESGLSYRCARIGR